jgi:hypothetical protein
VKDCCRNESKRSLRRHRDVATCDECGALLLAYGNDTDFNRTLTELDSHGVWYQTGTQGKLNIVAKARPGPRDRG